MCSQAPPSAFAPHTSTLYYESAEEDKVLAMAELAVGLAMARDPSVSSFEAQSFDSGVRVHRELEDGRPSGLVRYRWPADPGPAGF